MSYIINSFFLLILFSSCQEERNKPHNLNTECIQDYQNDTINKRCFFDIIDYFSTDKKFDSYTPKELIVFVKIVNTLSINENIVDSLKRKQIFELEKKNFDLILDNLKFSLSKGMGMYSQKYDLYIGGSYEMLSKSSFKVID